MELAVVGLNHKTAPAEVREKVAFSAGELKDALLNLKSEFSECAIISTCNRTEVYVLLAEEGLSASSLKDNLAGFLAQAHRLESTDLRPHLYCYLGHDVGQHLCQVASGLDSLVLGEPQILGQIKDAYRVAVEAESVGKVLYRLFHHTFEVVKKVRSETAIGREAASVGSAAVKLATSIFSDLSDKRALVLGAGDVAELVLKHLLGGGVKEPLVANRTYERAENLARVFEGKAVGFEDRYLHISAVDIIIVTTGARDYIVSHQEVREIVNKRGGRPLLFIDLSIPRNVDPEVGRVAGVTLHDIDGLSEVVEENIEIRRREARVAEGIIQTESKKYKEWMEAQEGIVPTIRALREMAEDVREKELAKVLSNLNGISPEVKQQIEQLTTSIVNKLVHRPIVRLKEASGEGGGEDYLQALRDLFGLDDPEERNQRG